MRLAPDKQGRRFLPCFCMAACKSTRPPSLPCAPGQGRRTGERCALAAGACCGSFQREWVQPPSPQPKSNSIGWDSASLSMPQIIMTLDALICPPRNTNTGRARQGKILASPWRSSPALSPAPTCASALLTTPRRTSPAPTFSCTPHLTLTHLTLTHVTHQLDLPY